MKTLPKIGVFLFTSHWPEPSHMANLVSGESEICSFPPTPTPNGLGNSQRFCYKEKRKEIRKPLTASASDIYWLFGGGRRNTITNKHMKKS